MVGPVSILPLLFHARSLTCVIAKKIAYRIDLASRTIVSMTNLQGSVARLMKLQLKTKVHLGDLNRC